MWRINEKRNVNKYRKRENIRMNLHMQTFYEISNKYE